MTRDIPQQLEAISPKRFLMLLEISKTLSSTLDLRILLERVIVAASDLTGTEYASILLIDRVNGKVHTAASTGPGPIDEAAVPLEGSAAGRILSEGQPLIINGEADHRYDDFAGGGQSSYRNMLGVPLVTKDRVIGVLEVLNRQAGSSYSDQDVAVLQSLASQAAVAIENARLFQQTDLISEFMHEVKTPLMALTAASELLAREDLGEKPGELVDMIQNETKRLAKMAQDFLDLARLESGRTQFAHEPVDLNLLIQDVIRVQKPEAARRDIALSGKMSEETPIVLGDYDRLKQVLLNLTSNAIKYNGEQGNVNITVCLVDDEVIVEIADTGPGIAKENLQHLFERFYRIPDSEGFTKGTGLGLSISARIIKEHGGRIDVASELGQGSTFRCYLPRP
ncbi:MAG TPA: GAF domain-containing sensor histidine kinase [Patescibacteria group bacterium]|nr:GAF domain-containing sensor histidine kinase [Patescibacteria group bacterium]